MTQHSGKVIIAFCILLCGCQSHFRQVRFAIGSTTPIERNIQSEGESVTYSELTYKDGYSLELYKESTLDLLYGPRLGIAFNEPGILLGLETEARLRWAREGVQPYLGIHAGTAYLTERWPEQGTNWGFTLGPMLGFKKDWWFVEYRFWHESNGTKAFGHDKGPNPGFNAGLLSIGVEW